MTAPAIILYVPPADRGDVLAPSVGGGTVPTLTWCWLEDTTGADLWCKPSQGARPHEPVKKGLLLSFKGVPDPIGMGRARDLLTIALDGGPMESMLVPLYDQRDEGEPVQIGWDLRTERRHHYFYAVPYPGAFDRSIAGLSLTDKAHALATILVARIGGSVVLA